MDIEIIREFIESINTANIEKLSYLMSDDHEFIDSRGICMNGKDNMKKAWESYFNLFPDYKIKITDTIHADSYILLLGYASGTFKPDNAEADIKNHWKVPATWKAIVKDDKIQQWQVYADNSPVMEIINKNK